MPRQTPGWSAEYVDLESETQALLRSVRKGPPGAAASKAPSPKKSEAKKRRGSNGSPRRRGRKRGGRATPKSGRSRSRSRQRRGGKSVTGKHGVDELYDAEDVDGASEASAAGPDDTFAGLIATATMNSTASTRGGSPHVRGRRRRRNSSKGLNEASGAAVLGRDSTNLEDSTGSEGGLSEMEPPTSDRSSGTDSAGGSPSAGASKSSDPNYEDSVLSATAKEQKERLEALERARAEEAKLRELSFRAEESRVREGLDGFIPHKVTQVAKAVKELDAEKARLNELESKMKAGGKKRIENLRRRDRRVAEVKAATDIERIVRGKLGRKRAHIKRKQKEMEAAGISLLPPLHPELPGPDPRDFGWA